MTAQWPERIIINGRSLTLNSDPLYRLLASRRMTLKRTGGGWSTACYRCYVGTWVIRESALYLVHLNLMAPDEEPLNGEVRERLFRAAPCNNFPVHAHWFNGKLRIPVGRRLIYSHHGWSHWFERERVVTVRQGMVTRDRLVDTRAMLERHLLANPHLRGIYDGSDVGPLGSLVWFEHSDSADDEDYRWPHDFGPGDCPL